MRAAYVERLGPVDAIRYGELPAPVPGPGEVLVRGMATAVNRVDTFVRTCDEHPAGRRGAVCRTS
ncbi:NADPH:quinone reductase-like Zn-dependent oxidoreductase [Sphaerisporangium krabiense]|uniref:NADPH:quinone reductase-like Zn-dependent oxidoreductase n=1 Tax=Sphaerisporangium krabiense TaxID=763782 RepID=A0A7W9DR42_9ACTN|nr:NADPH:quinone reductase-like Zn-dependent oxidoreductase [Sphaerisporangium krabiense]